MSVTSLRSVRNITPIENPDDLAFFDEVLQDRTYSGSKVRAVNLFGGHELGKQQVSELDKQEVDVGELDKQEKVDSFINIDSKNVLHVKSNNRDDIEDIYDFDYVKVNQNSTKESQQSGIADHQVSDSKTEYYHEENGTDGQYKVEYGKNAKADKDELNFDKGAQHEDVDKKHYDNHLPESYQEDNVNIESGKKTEFKSQCSIKSTYSASVHEGIFSDNKTSHNSPTTKDVNQDLNIDFEQISEKREDRQGNDEKYDIHTFATSHEEDNKQTHEEVARQTSEAFHDVNLDLNTRKDGKSNATQDVSENNVIEFDDSVETSYFAMFKKSENNETEGSDNRQNMEAGSSQVEETAHGANQNQTLSYAPEKDELPVDNVCIEDNVDIVVQDKDNCEAEGHKTIYEAKSDTKIELNEQKTKQDEPDDAKHQNIQTTEPAEKTMPSVPDDGRIVSGNEKADNVGYELDEKYENDSNDVDEPGRKASTKTIRSNASTYSKSAHAHKLTEPHRSIEEMKALERLKHTPYTEHLAKGYSKHMSNSSASHSKQQNPKQKKQRQHKPGADHRGGGESKKGDYRGKTDEAATQKKEPTPRISSGTASVSDKQNQAPKGKRTFFRRKERKPSATVTRPSKISDENMNDVKDVKEASQGADEPQDSVGTPADSPPEEKHEVAEQPTGPSAEIHDEVEIQETVLAIKEVMPDKTDGLLKTDPGEPEKPPEDPGQEPVGVDTVLEAKTPAVDAREVVAEEGKQEDESKSVSGKSNAETNDKGTPKAKKPKETVKLKTNGDEQKGSGHRSWFGGKKKQNQGDNSSLKNKTKPQVSVPVNGIIITTSSEDASKSEESALSTAAPAAEVPAALTIVDETKAEPHGKAGRLVLANIKQKLLKDSSSVPALPLSQRSRSPSPETSFSSNGSKMAKVAHKTQSMSSLQVPGAPTTPREPGQDDDNVSISSRRDSTSRRSVDYRIQDATTAMAPDAADEKPKSVLTNDETFIKNAIPYLPLSLAIVCLLLNIVVPGSGTALSGLSILCCGQARVSNKNDQILTTLCANCLVGLAQLFTVTFLLVGWFWSIGWGIQMVSLSVQHREEVKKQRAKELQALALSAFGSPKRGAPFGP